MATSLSTLTILSLQILILLFGSFCIEGSNGSGVLEVDNNNNKVQREFDYFVLALQWPGTYCNNTSYCCSTNACCRGSNSSTHFTIHGLWPTYNDKKKGPTCCSDSVFDENEISPLAEALYEYWPSLSCSKPENCNGTKGSFLASEWEKHGTCSSPVFTDEYTYFLATLNLYFKYNVSEVLAEAGYVPSNTEKYPLTGINSAIQNAYNATPQLICQRKALRELRLCFNKDFTPRDCVNASVSHSGMVSAPQNSCPKKFSLPESFSLAGFGNVETLDPGSTGSEAI